jgi:hypothetical protein
MKRAFLIFIGASFLVCGTAHAGQTDLDVPKDHFLGISKPCSSVAEARQLSRRDAIDQILRTMGAEYSAEFSSLTTGTPDRLQIQVSEGFSEATSGFLQAIESRIVRESVERTPEGFACTTLLRFPPEDIERARQLSLGAKVTARWVGKGIVELREVNGVPVVLTDYRIEIEDRHRHAAVITLFFVKVSEGSSKTIQGALPEPIMLRGGLPEEASLDVPGIGTSLGGLLLGTSRRLTVTVFGRDEVGRRVEACIDVR